MTNTNTNNNTIETKPIWILKTTARDVIKYNYTIHREMNMAINDQETLDIFTKAMKSWVSNKLAFYENKMIENAKTMDVVSLKEMESIIYIFFYEKINPCIIPQFISRQETQKFLNKWKYDFKLKYQEYLDNFGSLILWDNTEKVWFHSINGEKHLTHQGNNTI